MTADTIDSCTRRDLRELDSADDGLVRIIAFHGESEPAWWSRALTPAQLDVIRYLADPGDRRPHVDDFRGATTTHLAGLVAAGAITVMKIEPDHDNPHVRFEVRVLRQWGPEDA